MISMWFVASAGVDISLRRTTERDVNSTMKRKQQALDAIEQNLIRESQSKLDPAVVDIQPHAVPPAPDLPHRLF